MAAVTCKASLDGKVAMFVCYIRSGNRIIGMNDSARHPVPLAAGTYELVWELRGDLGASIALETSANGAVVDTMEKQTIGNGVRIGTGGPKSRPYTPRIITIP